MQAFELRFTGDLSTSAGLFTHDYYAELLTDAPNIRYDFLHDQQPKANDPTYQDRLYAMEIKPHHVAGANAIVVSRPQGWTDRPAPQPIPAGLDWELFLGRAPDRPYNIAYHPHDWRGWSEFGAGALGDMGCHTMDAAFYALNLGDPISIQAESPQAVVESFPAWSAITYEFPARGKMPPVKVTWSDGGKQPPRPKDLDAGRALTKSGQYYVGEKGTIFDGQDYCNSPRIIPEARMRELQPSLPPKTLRRPDPLGNPYLAWTQAIRKGDPEWAGSHFAYSTRLTEFVVLGNFALRAPGKKILWDGAQMAVTNLPELNQFLKPTFRSGWTHLELEKVQRNGTEDLSVPAQLRDGSPGYMKKNQKK